MNPEYQKIIAASDDERRGLFLETANQLGTTVQNIEKDFWVCWTLDALFHRLKSGGPRLLFKGGTSLSKAHNLISRFSEDVDITVFRADLAVEASVEGLEALSKTKRQARLDEIKAACQKYINDELRHELDALGAAAMTAAGRSPKDFRVTLDEDDRDLQSLLIDYPSAFEPLSYIPKHVKIEAGAKSALDPNHPHVIQPYAASSLPKPQALDVHDVVTIDPSWTFLDKILILHNLTYYYEAKTALRGNGRMSRHYYDVYRMMAEPVGPAACADDALIAACVKHENLFFARTHTGIATAQRGTFRLQPLPGMIDLLRADYTAMQVMIFGDVPSFEDVLAGVAAAEKALNAA
jgi:hypothetical protein